MYVKNINLIKKEDFIMKRKILIPAAFYGLNEEMRQQTQQIVEDAFKKEGIHAEFAGVALDEQQAMRVLPLSSSNPIYDHELKALVGCPSCVVTLEGDAVKDLDKYLPLGKSNREQRNFISKSEDLNRFFGNTLGAHFWDAQNL